MTSTDSVSTPTSFPAAAVDDEELSEVELMTRVGRGDPGAYRRLSDQHLDRIYNYSRRLLGNEAEAEDVTQETFLRLWTGARRWKPKAKLTTYLHRIAHNLCMDRLRRRKSRARDGVDDLPDSNRPSRLVERKQLAEAVETALASLPERQRAAVTLVHYQGLSNPDVANVLDVGVEAVESLLARGRRTLRERLAVLRAQSGGVK